MNTLGTIKVSFVAVVIDDRVKKVEKNQIINGRKIDRKKGRKKERKERKKKRKKIERNRERNKGDKNKVAQVLIKI